MLCNQHWGLARGTRNRTGTRGFQEVNGVLKDFMHVFVWRLRGIQGAIAGFGKTYLHFQPLYPPPPL